MSLREQRRSQKAREYREGRLENLWYKNEKRLRKKERHYLLPSRSVQVRLTDKATCYNIGFMM